VQETARQAAKQLVDARNGDKACALFHDFREILERTDIDAILMAPGERWTPIMGIAAARHGKHIYYEKPCALTGEGAKAVTAWFLSGPRGEACLAPTRVRCRVRACPAPTLEFLHFRVILFYVPSARRFPPPLNRSRSC